MKRSFLIALALCALLASCSGEKKPVQPKYKGDLDGDGKITEQDISILESFIAGEKNSHAPLELADLDGDLKVGSADIGIMKKLAAGEKADFDEELFPLAARDITDQLEDLGIQNQYYWKNGQTKNIVSRIPFDMISSGNRVYLSGGNYEENTGPVPVYYYEDGSDRGLPSGQLQTEQVNEFYQYDGYTFALSVDPKNWGAADVYYFDAEKGHWVTKSNVLSGCIHCYDMIKFEGKYFFCGSNNADLTLDGQSVDSSEATIFVLEGDISSAKREDFKKVPVITKDGEVLSGKSTVYYEEYFKGYLSSGIPRFMNIFQFKGELYALYYDHYSDQFRGIYRYDRENEQFIYDESIDGTFWHEQGERNEQDNEKILHKFQWKDSFYVITDDMFVTDDLSDFRRVEIPEHGGMKIQDVIFRGGAAYCLATVELSDGSFENRVFETEDFTSFRELFSFTSKLGAKSFELNCGAFYFGLGFDVKYETNENGTIKYDPATYQPIMILPEGHEEAGRVLRYRYYSSEKTE